MKIGELRHRITIQSPTYTRSVDGSSAISYVGSTTIWGRVTMLAQTESLQAEKQTAQTNIEVLVRYNTITEAITEKYQLVWDGKSYGITGIINDAMKDTRTITATLIQ